jgi:hypothetical protein
MQWSYSEAKRHADTIVAGRLDRIRKLSRQAHIDPYYEPHARNAWLAYKDGKPWPEVDYNLVRKILWMRSHLYDAYEILRRYCDKRDAEDPFWIEANQGKFA